MSAPKREAKTTNNVANQLQDAIDRLNRMFKRTDDQLKELTTQPKLEDGEKEDERQKVITRLTDQANQYKEQLASKKSHLKIYQDGLKTAEGLQKHIQTLHREITQKNKDRSAALKGKWFPLSAQEKSELAAAQEKLNHAYKAEAVLYLLVFIAENTHTIRQVIEAGVEDHPTEQNSQGKPLKNYQAVIRSLPTRQGIRATPPIKTVTDEEIDLLRAPSGGQGGISFHISTYIARLNKQEDPKVVAADAVRDYMNMAQEILTGLDNIASKDAADGRHDRLENFTTKVETSAAACLEDRIYAVRAYLKLQQGGSKELPLSLIELGPFLSKPLDDKSEKSPFQIMVETAEKLTPTSPITQRLELTLEWLAMADQCHNLELNQVKSVDSDAKQKLSTPKIKVTSKVLLDLGNEALQAFGDVQLLSNSQLAECFLNNTGEPYFKSTPSANGSTTYEFASADTRRRWVFILESFLAEQGSFSPIASGLKDTHPMLVLTKEQQTELRRLISTFDAPTASTSAPSKPVSTSSSSSSAAIQTSLARPSAPVSAAAAQSSSTPTTDQKKPAPSMEPAKPDVKKKGIDPAEQYPFEQILKLFDIQGRDKWKKEKTGGYSCVFNTLQVLKQGREGAYLDGNAFAARNIRENFRKILTAATTSPEFAAEGAGHLVLKHHPSIWGDTWSLSISDVAIGKIQDYIVSQESVISRDLPNLLNTLFDESEAPTILLKASERTDNIWCNIIYYPKRLATGGVESQASCQSRTENRVSVLKQIAMGDLEKFPDADYFLDATAIPLPRIGGSRLTLTFEQIDYLTDYAEKAQTAAVTTGAINQPAATNPAPEVLPQPAAAVGAAPQVGTGNPATVPAALFAPVQTATEPHPADAHSSQNDSIVQQGPSPTGPSGAGAGPQ